MRDLSGLAEFQFNGDHDDVSISKIQKEKSALNEFSEHLDTLLTDKKDEQYRWCKPGDMITIGNHVITSGNFYLGKDMMAENRLIECSLINPDLNHKFSDESYEDSTLKYWPEYAKISATCRGTYLFWLSGERNDPDTPLGYVFLYFYGIERRLLIDFPNGLVSNDEYLNLYTEVKRLKEIYGYSRSFRNYSGGLLDYISVSAPHIIAPRINSNDSDEISFELRFVLANMMKDKKPWPVDIAFKWAKLITNNHSKAIYNRCKEETAVLFKYHYEQEFNEGIVVISSKARLQFNYQTASRSIAKFKPIISGLYEPKNAQEENIKLAQLLLKVEKDLESYSRFLGKLENSRNENARYGIDALVLLPKSYLTLCDVPLISNFKEWLTHLVHERSGDVSLSKIWLQLNMLVSGKISKKELSLLTKLFEKTGYGFSPDPRYNPEKLKFDSDISIFKSDFEGDFAPSGTFYRVQALIKFGAILFSKDNDFDFNSIMMSLIFNDDLLDVEKNHLTSYLKWIVSSDLSIKGLKPFTKNLSKDDVLMISHSLVGMYASTGIVCIDKMKMLEKIYLALGIEKESVVTDLHNASSGSYNKVKTNTAEKIFEIDHDNLRRIESETSDVQSILGDIFDMDIENELENEFTVKKDIMKDIAVEVENFHGLSGNNLILFNELKQKEEWENCDVQSLCKKLNLMVDGAIEEINDWSFDLVDSPVIEIEDVIIIDLEIIEEIEGI
jgi:hypothetical protein